MREFYETKKMYREYTQYRRPLSYDEWHVLPEGHKAAVLFVQFFDQICLAWDKAKSYDGDEFEAIETVNQYLMKNVSKIDEDRKRFKPAYIYRVVYNACYCICHDRKRDKDRRELEVDPYVSTSEDSELNLMEFIPSAAAQKDFQEAENRTIPMSQKFWDLVESADVDAEVIVDYLLGSGEKPTKQVQGRKEEVLDKIKLTLMDHPEILECFMR